jgi:hypothetical protein
MGPVIDLASYLGLSVLTQDRHPAIRFAAAHFLGDVGQSQADLAEEPSRDMLPFAVELPAGKRRRAVGRAVAATRGTGP